MIGRGEDMSCPVQPFQGFTWNLVLFLDCDESLKTHFLVGIGLLESRSQGVLERIVMLYQLAFASAGIDQLKKLLQAVLRT